MSTRDDNQSMFNPSADWMEQQRKFGEQEAITALVQERDALKDRIAELEGDVARDAARYRFLREQPINGEPGQPVIAMPNGMRSGYYLNEETADHAVDTSMAAKEPSNA